MKLLMPSRRTLLKMGAMMPALTLPASRLAALGAPEQAQPPGFFRFTLGQTRMTVISDGYFTSPVSSTGVNAEPGDVQAFLIRHFQSTDELYRHTNHVVIELGDATVLVDVGSGDRFAPTTGRMIDNLEAAGFDQGDITHVALTHAHPDHIWGIRDDFDEALFPDAQYLIGAAEFNWWMAPGRVDTVPEELVGMVVGANNSLNAIKDHLNHVTDGYEIAPGITMIDTPGHTLGHMSLHIESNGEQLLVLGDSARHAMLSFEQPSWVGSVDMDPEATIATRQRLFDMAATDGIAVLGYHFPFPGVGQVMREGNAYRFIPALWQWKD